MDSLAISARAPSNVIERRLHPVANPTSTGWLDFRTSFSKFVSVTSTVDFIRQGKVSGHASATARAEDLVLPRARPLQPPLLGEGVIVFCLRLCRDFVAGAPGSAIELK